MLRAVSSRDVFRRVLCHHVMIDGLRRELPSPIRREKKMDQQSVRWAMMYCQLVFGKRVHKSNQTRNESGSAVNAMGNDALSVGVRQESSQV